MTPPTPDSFDSPDGRTYSGAMPGQAAEVPDAYARWVLASAPPEVHDLMQPRIAARWEHATGEAEREFWRSLDAAREPRPAPELAAAQDKVIRDILESLCRRDGLSLKSSIEPGEPARNYELADRLGIGHVFGLPDAAPAQPAPELAAATAESRALRALVAEIIEVFGPSAPYPATKTQIAKWRKRAGLPS